LYTVKRKRALQHIEASEESGIPWIYANKFDQHTEAYEARYLERIKNIARERMEQDERQRKQKKVFEFNASDMLSSHPDRVDHFKVLALSNDVGPREIKRAYWTIAKECHPDLNPGCRLSEERFKLVSHSYSELMKRYD
jgi:DnaJ-domain-containing protein 1